MFFPRQRHFLLRPRGSPGRPPSTCPPTCLLPTPHQQPMGEHCQRRLRQDSPGELELVPDSGRPATLNSTKLRANPTARRSSVPSSTVSQSSTTGSLPACLDPTNTLLTSLQSSSMALSSPPFSTLLRPRTMARSSCSRFPYVHNQLPRPARQF